MNKNKYVFAQLVEFLDCFKFRLIVAKYQTDKYIKSFSCWNQLLVIMLGQLAKNEDHWHLENPARVDPVRWIFQ